MPSEVCGIDDRQRQIINKMHCDNAFIHDKNNSCKTNT
ncbi:hypothetical protein BEI_0327 [Halomonas beimenensis]|uniref:Uncharacterized protein n=1 Tax=Halomonas beimenensis TaxID=475662 RepID=A0A291P349_9GAMM|nr:hypothetical protein BEI_0327 [Halomonas beimenensis]